jgi:hypothetical protein
MYVVIDCFVIGQFALISHFPILARAGIDRLKLPVRRSSQGFSWLKHRPKELSTFSPRRDVAKFAVRTSIALS